MIVPKFTERRGGELNFHDTSIRSYLAGNRTSEELHSVQKFSVDIITGIKRGDDEAFREFLEILDVKMCINKITGNIYRKFDNVTVEAIKNELNVLIFNFIKNNYRTYNQPNEIQMLLIAMYGWLGGKASKVIYDNLKNKNDNYLGCWEMMDRDLIAEVELMVAIEQTLTKDEFTLFKARYIEGYTQQEVADELGVTRQAIQKREKAIKLKLQQLYN